MVTLKVNGSVHNVEVDADTPLLWVIRDNLGLTGTKFCCGIGECGACTVHLDGQPVLSCVTSVSDVAGKEVTTIEGLKGPIADALFKAWTEGDVPQCGYCQPGQIMTAAALLASHKNPNEDDINAAMSAVLCRCGTYQDVKHAVQRAAKEVPR
jgi:isoquinoline 1-oxidoreductase alpha subunit